MIKISSTTQKELTCLCGLCEHSVLDEKCAYKQVIDKRDPNEELFKRIIALMRKEITRNVGKQTTTNSKQNKRK